MKSTDNRRLFGTLIGASAAAGNIATIPATQGTAGDGTASIALAFPPETFIARAAGGEPPRGADMNGFLNLLSSAVQVLQAGYLGPFDATFAAGIGGYPAGAVVSGSTAGTFWVSTADANTTVPGATGANWKSLFDGLATQAWATGAFSTLTQLANETTARTTADTTLQSAITAETSRATTAEAGKASLVGTNSFSGNQIVNGGAIYLQNGHREVFYSSDTGSDPGSYFEVSAVNVGAIQSLLRLVNSAGTTQAFWYLNASGLISGSAGTVALTSQLPFTDTAQRIQVFVTASVGGGTVVTFPTAFSTIPVVIAQVIQANTAATWNNSNISDITATGFTYQGHDQVSLNVLAVGHL